MTKTTSAQQIAFVSHLETLGIPLDGEAVSSLRKSSRGIEVCQTGYFFEVVELDCGGTGMTVSVGIENPSHTVITIDQFRLELPWTQLSWLKEPPKKNYGYQMPDPLRYPYARELVLNHRVGRKGKIYPGDWVEGVLLGLSDEPIPAEYADQQMLRTRLWVFDTRGNSYTCRVLLAVSRTQQVKRPKNQPRMYRECGDLFSGFFRPQVPDIGRAEAELADERVEAGQVPPSVRAGTGEEAGRSAVHFDFQHG